MQPIWMRWKMSSSLFFIASSEQWKKSAHHHIASSVSSSYNRSMLKTSQRQHCQPCNFLLNLATIQFSIAPFLVVPKTTSDTPGYFSSCFWRFFWYFLQLIFSAGADPSLSRYKGVSGGHSLKSRVAHCAAVWQMRWWQEQKEFSPLQAANKSWTLTLYSLQRGIGDVKVYS